MIGRPEEFREAARSLRAARGHVDSDRRRLHAMAVSVLERWESPAARTFESNEFPASMKSYGFVVEDLDDLAAMLDQAAGQLEEAIARTRKIEQTVRWWFGSQPLPEDGSPPRWESQHWRYRPGRFPLPRDSEWFAVRRYLRGLGLAI